MPAEVLSHLTAAALEKPRRQNANLPAWEGHIPFAFWAIEQWRPRIFVELGTHAGSSYFAFCQSVAAHQTGTQCFAVDSWQGDPHAGAYEDAIFNDVEGYNRSHYGEFSRLLRMRFDEALSHFANGSIDLLHIDGFHTYEAVRHDFETWLPKMSRRGVVLFHDSNVFKNNFGVWRLMCELEPRFPHFHFLHSHGLSMFTLSEEAPAEARWMTALSPAETRIWRKEFTRLGEAILRDARPEGAKKLPFHPLRILRARLRRSRARLLYSLRSRYSLRSKER
jgi:hypothetical protein